MRCPRPFLVLCVLLLGLSSRAGAVLDSRDLPAMAEVVDVMNSSDAVTDPLVVQAATDDPIPPTTSAAEATHDPSPPTTAAAEDSPVDFKLAESPSLLLGDVRQSASVEPPMTTEPERPRKK